MTRTQTARAVATRSAAALTLLRRTLPPQLRDPAIRAPFLRWAMVGAAIRIALLPVGVSSDTLAVYWRAHVIAFHGEVFRDYLVNMGSHLIHAGWLLLVQPLLGPADALWTHPWWWQDPFGLAPQHLEAFLARTDALRAITLLKLPYVAAEVAAGLVLLWLLWGRGAGSWRPVDVLRRSRRAWVLWMLSPAALYATLLFARYEAYPVLAVLVALLLAERDRPVWAAVVLGLAVTLRAYPIVLIPVAALILYRGLPRQVAWSALALVPFATTMLFNRATAGTFGELATVGDFSFGGNFFAFALQPDRGGPGVYLFVAGMLALYAYLFGRARAWWGSGPVARDDLWRWLVLAHLVLFALTQFSAHYLMWIVPAVALLAGRTDRPGIVPLHLIQVAGVFVAAYVLWGGILFTGTLGGLGETARTLLPPGPVLSDEGARQVANVAWSAFFVATAALAGPFLLDTLRRVPGEHRRAA